MIKCLLIQSGVINEKNNEEMKQLCHTWSIDIDLNVATKMHECSIFESLGSSLLLPHPPFFLCLYLKRRWEKMYKQRNETRGQCGNNNTHVKACLPVLKFPGAWFVACAPWIYLFSCVFIIHSPSFQHCLSSCGEDAILVCLCFLYLHVFSWVALLFWGLRATMVKAFFSYPSNNKPKAKICLAEFTWTKKVIWM